MPETQLQGTVLRITFRNEESGYTVAKVHCEEIASKEIAVVGYFPSIDVGEFGIFKGEWVNDPQYGRQFSASSLEFIMPTTAQGIERLLSKGKFRGIGKVYAKKIVDKFGKETIDVIENRPHLLQEISGIGPERIEEIKKSWYKKKALKNINLFLAENEIPLHFAEKIYSRYRENSLRVLKNNPYQLTYEIRGIGFRTADRIALDIGIKPDSRERIQAAIIYVLQQSADEGHVYLPRQELVVQCTEFLKIDEDAVKDHIEILRSSNIIVVDQERVYIRYMFANEINIAYRIYNILNSEINTEYEDLNRKIDEIEKKSGISYTERQKEAVKAAIDQKILIITGGPGTGKTTIIRGVIELFLRENRKVRLAAPTGRAAKRMEETCKIPAQTIHRLLEYNPREHRFFRSVKNPVDGDVVIIDETSMIDTPLMASLLCGIDNKTRIVFVGDADQLPSVGPGNVLKDLIESKVLPVIQLDTVFRQAETSDIVGAAHDINNMIVPNVDNKEESGFFFIYEKDTDKIPQKMVDLVVRRLPARYGFNPVKDIQVITPMYKGNTGANNLNALLQQALCAENESIKLGEREFHNGDKVMQIHNNYSKEVYNGDIGFIKTIDHENNELSVRFEDRMVTYEFRELDQLVHAYAITVHKSQGSEYRAVIMPLTTQHFIMLQKNLLYTAVSRAKELIILIGTFKAFNIAVKNDKTAQRFSFLEERLRNPKKYSEQLNLLESEEPN